MRKHLIYGPFLFMILFFLFSQSACVSVAPLNSSFESARTLKKGNLEFMGSYSHYRSAGEESNKVALNNNIGFRAGVGVTDWLDVKLRYENLIPVEGEDVKIHYLGLAPKVRLFKDYISFTHPVGLYFAKDSEGTRESHYFITPKMLFSYSPNKFVEGTFAVSTHFIFFDEETESLLGLNVGLALSSDIEKWAIRPEFGWMKDFDADLTGMITFGAAFSFTVNTKRQIVKSLE